MQLSTIINAIKGWYLKNFTFKGLIAALFFLYCAVPDYGARNEFWKSKVGTMEDLITNHWRLLLAIAALIAIWLDHRRVIAKSRPKPSGLEIGIESLLYQFDSSIDSTVFVASIFLVNTGAPTIAQTWRGRFLVGNSGEDMQGFFIIDKYEFKIGKDTLTLENKHLIQSHVLTRQIATGDARAGRIIFSVKGNRLAQINSLQFKIEITCQDYLGKVATGLFTPDPKPSFAARNHTRA